MAEVSALIRAAGQVGGVVDLAALMFVLLLEFLDAHAPRGLLRLGAVELSFLGATLHVSTHAPSTCTGIPTPRGGSGRVPEPSETGTKPRYWDRVKLVRARYSRAYERWDQAEEERLRHLRDQGLAAKQISKELQRQPGAVRSRLTSWDPRSDDLQLRLPGTATSRWGFRRRVEEALCVVRSSFSCTCSGFPALVVRESEDSRPWW